MDIKEAIQLIKQDRLEDIDIENIWELEEILSSSNDYSAIAAYIAFKKTNIAQNLNTISLQMKSWVDLNLQTMNNIDKGFNLFQLNSSGRFVYPEAKGIFSFFNNVNVNTSKDKKDSDNIDKKNVFESFYSLGKLGAKEKLCLNKSFSKLKPQEQTNLYKEAIVNSMQEDTFVLVANQIFEDAMKKNLQAREFVAPEKLKMESDAYKRFNAITNEADTSYKISNTNVIGTLGASVNRIAEFSDMVEEKTQSKALSLAVKRTDDKFAVKYPIDYPQLSPLKKAMSLSFIAGPVGIAAHNASKLSKNIKDFTKKEGSNLFNIIKSNPTKAALLSAGIVATITASQASIGSGIDMGLVGRSVADNWKVLTTSIPLDVVGNTLSSMSKSVSVAATTIKASLAVVGAKASNVFAQKNGEKKTALLKDLKETIFHGPLGKALQLNKKEKAPTRSIQKDNVVNFEPETIVKQNVVEKFAAPKPIKEQSTLVAASYVPTQGKTKYNAEFNLNNCNTEPKVVTSNIVEAQSERNTSLIQPKVFYNRALFKVAESKVSTDSLNQNSTKLAVNARNEYFARRLSGR